MKKLNLLFLFLIPLIARAQSHCVTIKGNTTNGKFRQVNVSTETPDVSDSSMSEIDVLSWDDGNGPYNMRSYLRYDMSEIPAGSVVISAHLSLRAKVNNVHGWNGFPTLDENDSYLKRVTSAWTSGAISWNNQPSVDDATAVLLEKSTDSTQDYTLDVKSFVQYWIDHPGTNNGMQLRIIHEEYHDGSLVFESAQATDSLQPTLEICYHPGSSGSCTAGFHDTLYAVSRSTHYFTLQTDSSGGRTPVQICWSWGDSTSNCFTYDSTHPYNGAPFVHTYPNEYGSYIACVTVSYQDSCQAVSCNYVTNPSTCTAGCTVTPEGPESRKYYFHPLVSNNAGKTPVRICLSYGDGSDTCLYYDSIHPYSNAYLAHTYSGNDPYQACVTVQYQDSCNATYCVTIPPSALCNDQYLTLKANLNDPKFQQVVLISPVPGGEWPGVTPSDHSQSEMVAAVWTCDMSGCDRRTLFRYDVSEIPANATIQHAYLYLYAKTNNIFGAPGRPMVINGSGNDCILQKVAAPWSNATGWETQPPVTGLSWSRSLQASDTPRNYAVDVTELVQRWVSKVDSNYGWLLRIASEEDVYNSMVFTSSLAPDSLKPKLRICYSLPADTATARIAVAGETTAARLYPNPATDALTLQIRSNKPQMGSIYLHDIQGRLLQVLKTEIQLTAGNNIVNTTIDRKRIPAGMYFVKVHLGNTLRTYKVTLR